MFVEFMMAVCHDLAFSQLFLCICCSFLHLLTANVLGVGGWAEKVSQSNANKTPPWIQLAQMLTEPKQAKSIQETKVVEMKRDRALADNRQESTPQTHDAKEINAAALPKATSLVVDTSTKETNVPSGMAENPPNARQSSFKFTNFKQHYHKQRHRNFVREFPKTADDAKPTMVSFQSLDRKTI